MTATPSEPPSDCKGYPPLYWQDKPKREVNFFLPTENHILACSWLSPSTEENDPKSKSFNDVASSQLLHGIHPSLNHIDRSKSVIIICHGLYSWRNQMLLANLAHRLTNELSCHTLRFDFTGNGQSSGKWTFDGFETDFKDLCSVYNFIIESMKCKVRCIIGHSQGSAAVLKHAAMLDDRLLQGNDGEKMDLERPSYVNLSGRCAKKPMSQLKAQFSHKTAQKLSFTGNVDSIIHVARKGNRDMVITTQSLINRSMHEMSDIAARIKFSKVLTIHGANDDTVPVSDAQRYHEIIHNHTLKIIDNADHNFNGLIHLEGIVSTISDFLK